MAAGSSTDRGATSGAVLVTGGTGALGALVALWTAQQCGTTWTLNIS